MNLGHLIHRADNYRGSFRGEVAERRTDAMLPDNMAVVLCYFDTRILPALLGVLDKLQAQA
ncbi:type VI secretion system Vgr family protein [Chitinimonas sp. BJB300]|uniref:type VI secretion system Vgr family protein n=1 Tax=Chitinimonas sp. BJB300 TaxID=1559339 RepID=UPI000C11967C|nr:type VI secretion system Vgr family protein [Chitinimonas sp. BJB300]PHV12561.1 hypothetical protein CSQ89_05060 [Chitinimonas sp. BJB300]